MAQDSAQLTLRSEIQKANNKQNPVDFLVQEALLDIRV